MCCFQWRHLKQCINHQQQDTIKNLNYDSHAVIILLTEYRSNFKSHWTKSVLNKDQQRVISVNYSILLIALQLIYSLKAPRVPN